MTDQNESINAFWNQFKQAAGHEGNDYEALSCGDSPQMRDELAELIFDGPKRATAGLLRDFTEGGEQMPAVGDLIIVLDGSDTPRCIWKTTEVRVKPLDKVDAQFAWDEGEGDRSLEWWMQAHRAYFQRQAEREGFVFRDDMDVVLERFRVVWPPEAADPE
ncbi:MAG: ASCH domain-containing protein [Pseudomonadota bacterium]